jgi:hypothetical protein
MFDTYIVPRDSFDLRSKRIAIVPLSVPPDIEEPDSVINHFGGLIEGFLTRTGVDIVPAREYRAIWNRLTQEAGGFFDPYTGLRDEPKYRAGVAQLMKEVHERFEPDAFLYPELWVVEAPLSSGTAHWDGASRDLDPAPFGIESVWAVTLAVVIEVLVRQLAGRQNFEELRVGAQKLPTTCSSGLGCNSSVKLLAM